MTADEQKRRGAEAKRLLDEPLLKEAFATIERNGIEELLRITPWTLWGDRKRRRMADQINTIRSVRGYLATVIAIGDRAEKGPMPVA